VVVRNLSKTYRTRRGDVLALNDVSIEVGANEILVLLGPSGCGKTTLLRCVAGLERPDGGEIVVQGKTVFSSTAGIALPPEDRHLSMVFQSYALWPHMTVFENVAYPLRSAKLRGAEVEERTRAVLSVVGLFEYAAAYPGQLSGGQQQRVALARAIVANEGVVLFDEPLSNLDAKVREHLRVELLALHRDIQFSALYVTHDQTEATALGERIAVMNVGSVAQVGTPREVYYQPNSRYVAEFIGSANEIPGTFQNWADEYCSVTTPLGTMAGTAAQQGLAPGQPVTLLFRPEHCSTAGPRPGANHFACRIERSMLLGSYVEYLVSAGDVRLVLRNMEGEFLAEGTEVTVWLDPKRTRVFPAATGAVLS